MIEFTPLQLVNFASCLVMSGILIGAIIGYCAASQESEKK